MTTAEQARENHRAWKLAHVVFDEHDGIGLETLRWNVLTIYRERMQGNAKELRQIAAALRAGEPVPMFAEGESGARAADRLAEQFERQDASAERFIEKLGDWLDAEYDDEEMT